MLEKKSQALLSLQDKGMLYDIDMSFKDRLKQARKAKPRLTQAAVASALGVTPQAVSGWERGEAMPEPDKFPLLSNLLDADIAWLLGDSGTVPHGNNGTVNQRRTPTEVPLQIIPNEQLMGKNDLPVFSIVQGGRGAPVLSNEPFTRIARPHNLLGLRDAYGVLVKGSSMALEFNEGDIAYVDPHRHPREGNPCVFQCHADDGEVHAIIKYLARSPDASDTLWFVKQTKPAKRFTLKKSDWQICHVVVGKQSGL